MFHGYKGAQIWYGTKSHCINVYGFKRTSEFPDIYREFIRENGAPSLLRRDNAREEKSAEVIRINRDLYIKDGFSEPYNQHQNPVERGAIKWLKEASHVLMDRTGAPEGAWYFAIKYLAAVHSICYDKTLRMPPLQFRSGVTQDISAYLQFTFWQRVLYLDHEGSWPSSKERPAYWCGIADNVGDKLTYWVYDDQMKRLMSQSVVRPYQGNHRVKWDPSFANTPFKNTARNGGDLMPDKATRDTFLHNSMDKYDQQEPEPTEHFFNAEEDHYKDAKTGYEDPGIDVENDPTFPVGPDSYSGASKLRFGSTTLPINPEIPTIHPRKKMPHSKVKYKDTYHPPESEVRVEQKTHKCVAPNEKDSGEKKISGQLEDTSIPDPGEPKLRRSSRLKEHTSKVHHTSSKDDPNASHRTTWKPTKMHKLFNTANAIAGALFLPTHIYAESAVTLHPEGTTMRDLQPLIVQPLNQSDKIEDLRAYHMTLDRLNSLLDPEADDGRWQIAQVEKHLIRERPDGSCPIYLKIQYTDGEKAYHTMDVVRTHDPMVVARYATNHGLTGSKGWEWVLKYVESNPLSHALTQVFKVTAKEGTKYKFGVEVPHSPKHALEIDAKNHNSGWNESMGLEIVQLNDYKTFLTIPNGQPLPKGYKRIPYHIVFDVKFDGRLKSRLVAGGHRTPDVPKEDVFSSVVSMEAVRLGFIMAKMNKLMVCAGDVGNAFLYGKTKEKVYIVAGPEFGPDLEGKRLIIDKALYGLKTSAARFHEHLSAKLRKMSFRPSKADPDLWIRKLPNGTFEYIARFVDDVIAFSKTPMEIMDELKRTYVMKGVGKPEYYLGGDVVDLPKDWEQENITTAFSAQTYIRNCVPKLAEMCGKKSFPSHSTPFSDTYHSELDDSPFCDAPTISKYKSLLGSANWVITLGRYDIAYAVSTLARYTMAPREGHFKAMERLFGYLNKYAKGHIVLDSKVAPIRAKASFNLGANWVEFYPDACEALPHDMPEPSGESATLTCFVDADHARDKVTCRSVTGIILLLNNTPISWISKRQKTVETSTYGSELVASRIAVDLLVEMRYKLCMLGVPVEEQSVLVGDNMSVVINTTLPSSSLKKKHQACNYHRVREAIAAGFIIYGHIASVQNLADICTKPLPSALFHSLLKDYMFRRPKYITETVPATAE